MKDIKGCYVNKINETGQITKNETDFKVGIRYVKKSIISQLFWVLLYFKSLGRETPREETPREETPKEETPREEKNEF